MLVFVIGDFNVCLDCTDDPHTRQLLELVGSFGFTHQQEGTTDAIFTRQDLPSPLVQMIDMRLSAGLVSHHQSLIFHGRQNPQ